MGYIVGAAALYFGYQWVSEMMHSDIPSEIMTAKKFFSDIAK